MKQTWHLIGRSVDAHLLIVHWGFLDACLDVVFIWDFDMLDYWWLILLHCLAYWFWFWHDCSDHFTCIHSPLYITQLDMLILWLVYYFDRLWAWCCITIRLDCRILAYLVCTWVTYPALPDCMMHDCPPSAWLHVICLCGSHFYPPISNSLGFGHSFHLGSHYCKCETFCVLARRPSRRLGVGSSDGLYRCTGAFWRRATLWCRLESDHWRPI